MSGPLPEHPRPEDQTPDESALNSLKPGQLDTAAMRSSRPVTDAPLGSTALRQLEVEVPVGHRAWADQLARHLGGLIEAKGGEAHIRLHPSHLGALEVRIHSQGGEAHIQVQTQHDQVREALEAALPRLRESLQGNGIHFATFDISRQHSPFQTTTASTGHGQGGYQGFGANHQYSGEQGDGRQSPSQPIWHQSSFAREEIHPGDTDDEHYLPSTGAIDYWL